MRNGDPTREVATPNNARCSIPTVIGITKRSSCMNKPLAVLIVIKEIASRHSVGPPKSDSSPSVSLATRCQPTAAVVSAASAISAQGTNAVVKPNGAETIATGTSAQLDI